ncbi:MAG: hypothetical protein ACK4PI_02460 [Tepidisphaerales bacterium]
MTALTLTAAAIALPLAASVLLLVLWPARLLLEGLLSALPGRLERFLPAPGRVSRAVAWTGLFGALLPMLPLPVLLVRESGHDAPLLFGIDVWLLAVTVAVVGLCAAVSAWADEAGRGTWVLVTAVVGVLLLALAARDGVLTLVALDAAGWLTAVALTLTGRPDTVDALSLRRAVRRWLVVLIGSSWAMWWGLTSDAAWGPALLAGGLLARAGFAGLHTGPAVLLTSLPTPLAMMAGGATMPVAVWLLADTLGSSTTAGLLGVVGAAVVLLAVPQETALRGVAARWAVAVLTLSAGTACLLETGPGRVWGVGGHAAWSPRPAGETSVIDGTKIDAAAGLAGEPTGLAGEPGGLAGEPAGLVVAAAAVAVAMAVYVAGAVQRAAGHDELSRLGGLAARVPGLFGWSVAGVMLLSGTFPFATALGRWLLAMSTEAAWPLTTLLAVAGWLLLTAALTTVHRVFLGLPRMGTEPPEPEPLELAGRERLVLLLLAAAGTFPLLAPLTLFRG